LGKGEIRPLTVVILAVYIFLVSRTVFHGCVYGAFMAIAARSGKNEDKHSRNKMSIAAINIAAAVLFYIGDVIVCFEVIMKLPATLVAVSYACYLAALILLPLLPIAVNTKEDVYGDLPPEH
jgi:hypothetical protein